MNSWVKFLGGLTICVGGLAGGPIGCKELIDSECRLREALREKLQTPPVMEEYNLASSRAHYLLEAKNEVDTALERLWQSKKYGERAGLDIEQTIQTLTQESKTLESRVAVANAEEVRLKGIVETDPASITYRAQENSIYQTHNNTERNLGIGALAFCIGLLAGAYSIYKMPSGSNEE